MRTRWSRIAAVVSVLAMPSGQAPARPPMSSDELLIYNAQHESLTKEWIDAFTKETGIKVTYRQGGDTELGNQLIAEGASSPADVFLTENSPAMAAVEKAGLFADVDPSTIAQVPPQYRPATGKWTGVAARTTVFAYNKTKLTEAQLPESIMDLEQPEWKGRWGAPPVKADFQAIVAAMLQLTGEPATAQWLAGMKANAKIFQDNIATLRAVNDGQVDGGVIYHYYWFRDQAKTKEISGNTALHYFRNEDPGAFVSISGGGVLKSSKKKDQAQTVPDVHHQQGRPGSAGEGHLVRVPGGQRRARQPRARPARRAAGAGRQPVGPGRPEGHRPDDEGRPALGGAPPGLAHAPRRSRGRHTAARPGPLVAVTVAILVAATFVPLGYVGWAVVTTGWTRSTSCSRGRGSANCCVNTVGLVVVTVPLCVVLGVGAAWLVERTDLPGRAAWRPLFVAPLAVPAFINSYAWVSVVPSLHGLGAGVLVATLSYFPFVYVPAAATLRRLDPAIEESARALGSGSAGVFFRVVLPQLRLAILGGGLLIGVHLLAEYGAFAMLRFSTPSPPRSSSSSRPRSTAQRAARSPACWCCCAWCCWSPRRRRAGNARYARIGAGAPRAATPIRLGAHGIPGAARPGRAAAACARRAGVDDRCAGCGSAAPQVWALGDIVHGAGPDHRAGRRGGPAHDTCWPSRSRGSRCGTSGVLARFVEGANFVTSSMPGIVTALALVTVAIRSLPPLYQTVALVLCRLRADVPAPRDGEPAVGAGPGARRSRGGLPVAGHLADAHVPAGHVAAHRTCRRGGRVAGIRRRRNRTDRHAAARPDRHQHAGDAVLVAVQRTGLRGRGAVRACCWSLLAVPVTVVLFRQSTKAAAL